MQSTSVRRRRARREREGATLLEVLIAMAILSSSGIALATYAVQAASAMARARASEMEMRRASAFFDAIALWPREDLDRHLGDHVEGVWRLIVERPLPTLYTLTLENGSTRHVVLHTDLFRRLPLENQRTH